MCGRTRRGALALVVALGIFGAAMVAAGSAVAAGGPLFSAGPASSLPDFANGIVSDTFTSSGEADVATTDYSDGNVNIMLGDGNGHFTAAPGSPMNLGEGVGPITSGVFTDSPDTDLAVGNEQNETVTILLGGDDGIFTPATPFTLDCQPVAMTTGAFRGAVNNNDIAVATGCGTVDILEVANNGTITRIGMPIALPTGGCHAAYANGIVAGTFGANSNVDLAVLDGENNQVDVLNGNNAGTFTNGMDTFTGVAPACSGGIVFYGALSLAEGSFGGSHPPDLAVGFQFGGDAEIMLGNGAGKFTATTPTQIAPDYTSIEYLAPGQFNLGTQGLAASDYWQGGGYGTSSFGDWVSVADVSSSGQLSAAPGSPYEIQGVAGALTTGAFAQTAGDDIVINDGEGYQCKYYGLVTLLDQSPNGGPAVPGNEYAGDGCKIPPPTVTAGQPTGVTLTGATMTGTISQTQGTTVTACEIKWGVGGSFNETAPCTQTPNVSSIGVTATLANLKGETNYEYELVVTAGGSTVTSKPQSFETCAATSVPVSALGRDDKKMEIWGCFTLKKQGLVTDYDSTSDVRVNGLTFSPANGSTVTVDPSAPSIHVQGPGAIKVGPSIPVYGWATGDTVRLSGTLTLFDSSSKTNKYKPLVFGFPLSGKLTAQFSENETELTGTAMLNVVEYLPNIEASLSLITDNESGIAGAGIAVKGPGEAAGHSSLEPCTQGEEAPKGFTCSYPVAVDGKVEWALLPDEPALVRIGPLAIEDLELTYDGAKHEWSGGGAISIANFFPEEGESGEGGSGGEESGGGGEEAKEANLASVIPTLGFTIDVGTKPLQLDGFSASDQDLKWEIGPVTISDLSARVEFHPAFGIGGSLGLMTEGGWQVAGGFDYQLGDKSGFEIKIDGNVSLSELATIGGFLQFDDRDGGFKVDAGGTYTRNFGPAYASLSVSGGLSHENSHWNWELDGNGNAGVFGVSISATGVLSNAGAGACGSVPIIGDIGFKHFWSGETDFDGCDFSGIQTVGVGSAVDAAAGRSITIPAGTKRYEFAATGASAPPAVTLTGPGGETLSTPTQLDHMTITQQGMSLAVSSSRTTYFIVANPPAGRWTIAPAAGATPPPVSYGSASPLRPLKLTAHVTGKGRRRTLRWRFAAQRGVSVQFLQTGGTEQQITSSTRGTGHSGFQIAAGMPGARHVIAIVSIDGFPRETLTVARFSAPAPSLPHVAHAKYRVHGSAVGVSWGRVRHAGGYEITIKYSKSSATYEARGSRTSSSFKAPLGQKVKSVTVTVSIGGLIGRPVKAKDVTPPPKRKHHHR